MGVPLCKNCDCGHTDRCMDSQMQTTIAQETLDIRSKFELCACPLADLKVIPNSPCTSNSIVTVSYTFHKTSSLV